MNYKIYEMFPKPLIVLEMDEHLQYKKILEKYYIDDVDESLRKKTNNNIFIFEDLKEIKKNIKKCCLQFYRNCCGFDVECEDIIINSSWFNIVNPNKFLYSHCHRNSHVSGVYYVSIDKINHPPLIFEDRDEFIKSSINEAIFSLDYEIKTKYNANSFTYHPTEGEICLFKSDIWHGHFSNTTNEPRISLAFNSVLKTYNVGDKNAKSYKVNIEE
jgi:uncharacterized protein (TIGR02466 family)